MKITRTESEELTHDCRKWKNIRESFKIKDIEYSRSGYEINGEVSESISASHFKSDGKIGVLCGICQNKYFTLSYGDYEISARCSKCGFDSVVYSG